MTKDRLMTFGKLGLTLLPLLIVPLLIVGCSDDDVVGVESGEVEVEVVTTGEALDDGYTLIFGADVYTTTISANETITVELDVGTYSLELTDVADNCGITGDNPLTVEISSGTVVSAAFAIVCTAL